MPNKKQNREGAGQIVKFKVAPEQIRDYLRRLGPNRKKEEYRGGHAQIAHPGIVIARLWGDAKVDSFLLWASPIYDDPLGRKRIDVGFGVCMGEAGVNRIEYGDDHVPMFDAASIEGNLVTEKYFKKVEIFTGTDDQSYSTIMAKHLDPDDIPRYRGLCCFFIRGLKLWKFPERAVPHVRTVGVRNVSIETPDVYEEEYFTSTSGVSGIKSMIAYDNKIFAVGNINVAGYLDLTDNSWNTIDGLGFLVPFQTAMAVINGKLYGGSNTGLYEYDDDGTWTQINSLNIKCLDANPNANEFLYGHVSSVNELRTYNGIADTMYGNLPSGSNPASCVHTGGSDPLYASSTNELYRYVPLDCPTTNWCEIYDATTNILTFINVNGTIWITKTASGGASAQLTLDRFGDVFTDTISVIGTPLSCYALCSFANKTHLGVVNTGTDGGYIYRFDETLETFTKLPRPTGVPTDTTVSVTCCTSYNNKLYVGSNKGIWTQGDV